MARLLQCGFHDLLGDALDLDVHLQRGNAFGGTGHFEVHVTEMVLVTEDIGEDGELLPSLTRPIAIPATGAFIGTPASINASDAPQTVAIELEPFDSVISDTTRMAYGKSSIEGSIACNTATRQTTMADLAPPRRRPRARFPPPNTEGSCNAA